MPRQAGGLVVTAASGFTGLKHAVRFHHGGDGGDSGIDDHRIRRAGTQRLAGIRPLRQELRNFLPTLVDLDDASREQFSNHMAEVSDAQLIALASQILELPSERKQTLLEAGTLSERFLMVYEDLYRHLDQNPEFGAFSPEELN